ncbi:MAG: SHOCT domain-containing protein, partial [Pedobacter sp.]|nr:SHOCT domain-containing protein [Pedobacter sp.]
EQLEKVKTIPGFDEKISVFQNENLGDDYASYIEIEDQNTPSIAEIQITEPEDELTQKLQKLKTLYEKQLISQEEYENKKAEILARL